MAFLPTERLTVSRTREDTYSALLLQFQLVFSWGKTGIRLKKKEKSNALSLFFLVLATKNTCKSCTTTAVSKHRALKDTVYKCLLPIFSNSFLTSETPDSSPIQRSAICRIYRPLLDIIATYHQRATSHSNALFSTDVDSQILLELKRQLWSKCFYEITGCRRAK